MRLRKERIAAELSQHELSQLSGVNQSTISKLESGVMLQPTFDTLDRLADALRRVGRKVDAKHLNPKRQPALIKGYRTLRKRNGAA